MFGREAHAVIVGVPPHLGYGALFAVAAGQCCCATAARCHIAVKRCSGQTSSGTGLAIAGTALVVGIVRARWRARLAAVSP